MKKKYSFAAILLTAALLTACGNTESGSSTAASSGAENTSSSAADSSVADSADGTDSADEVLTSAPDSGSSITDDSSLGGSESGEAQEPAVTTTAPEPLFSMQIAGEHACKEAGVGWSVLKTEEMPHNPEDEIFYKVTVCKDGENREYMVSVSRVLLWEDYVKEITGEDASSAVVSE